MKSDNPNIQRWLDNADFQNFMRQLYTDCAVALKNGVSLGEVRSTVGELCKTIIASLPEK